MASDADVKVTGNLSQAYSLTTETQVDVKQFIGGDLTWGIQIGYTMDGTGTNGGVLAQNLNPITLTGEGSVTNKGYLDVSYTLTTTTSALVQGARLDEQIQLTLTAEEGQRVGAGIGDMTMPGMTGEAEIRLTTVDVELPILTSEATILPGRVADVDSTVPMVTLEVSVGHDAELTTPALESTASMEPGRVGVMDSEFPALTLDASTTQDNISTVDQSLPALISSAQLVQSALITVDTQTPAVSSTAVVVSGNVGTATISASALSLSAFLAEQTTSVAANPLPAFYSLAVMDNGQTITYNPYAMNTENYGVTEYDNYAFHTVFKRHGKYYGAGPGGIFELSGSDDEGTAIAATFKLGFNDLKQSSLKRVPYAYLGYTSDGDLSVDVSIDGQPATRQYSVGLISHESGIKRGRAKIARGLKSRYWQFGVSNVAGSDFEIDTLGVYVQQFDRKAQ